MSSKTTATIINTIKIATNSICKVATASTAFRNDNSELLTDYEIITSEFNKFFGNIGTKITDKINTSCKNDFNKNKDEERDAVLVAHIQGFVTVPQTKNVFLLPLMFVLHLANPDRIFFSWVFLLV